LFNFELSKKGEKKRETKHDIKERKEKREASVEEEALVKTALSYVSLNAV